MPIYKYKCLTCDEEFDSIESMGNEISYCPKCKMISKRLHGVDIPSPPKLIPGCGGFYSPSFGERKYG